MNESTINFYHFSGTGNTLLVVKEMEKIFKAKGLIVDLHPIEKTNPKKIKLNSIIGLAFPVAFQSTFPFLWNFFKSLPETKGTSIFMVDTMMSFSGAIVGPLKKILKSKGYNCIGAKEIVMPGNWFPKKINQQKNKTKISNGLFKAREYAENLIKNKTSWKQIPLLSAALYNLCCNSFIMHNINLSAGKKITVNKEKCTKCGLCARLCPVDNIIFNKDYPQWNQKCQLCMRCLCFCPAEAVYIPNKEFSRYSAVKAKELLLPL